MSQHLLEWAAQRGYRVAWGPASVVESVCREILARKAGSEIEENFFEQELKSIVSAGASDLGKVLVVAKPRSAHRVRFELGAKIFDALLPPTYFRYRATFEDVRQDLAERGLPGSRVELFPGPLKGIACRLGLVVYGRNNVGYVPGAGSYFQLCGYMTDAVLPEIELNPPALLPDCAGCSICSTVCPTGAIGEDRVLLHGERCLTHVNEYEGEWPDWVSPKAHNALLGCLECQRACPANPELPVEDTGIVFSATETRILLSGEAALMGPGPENGIRSKLAWLGQPTAEFTIGRNLKALLHANKAL